jgi:hypothetical protein
MNSHLNLSLHNGLLMKWIYERGLDSGFFMSSSLILKSSSVAEVWRSLKNTFKSSRVVVAIFKT